MKLFAPKYYLNFKCIADKCKNSCCVGWEIDIDSSMLERYRTISCCGIPVIDSVDTSDSPHFRLLPSGRCPHLDACGLCNIIKEHGEEYLTEICREHPRFYNYTPKGAFVGLGIVCEEAARIVLSSDDYGKFYCISENNSYEEYFSDDPLISNVFDILSDRGIPYSSRLSDIYDLVGVSPKAYSDEYMRDVLLGCELTDYSHSAMLNSYSSDFDLHEPFEEEKERFLAYLIFRHCTASENEHDLKASFGFAFTLERLYASLIRSNNVLEKEQAFEIASMISLELEYSEDNTEMIKLEFII